MSHHVTPCHTMSHHTSHANGPESGECSPANVGADVSPRRNHGFHSSMGVVGTGTVWWLQWDPKVWKLARNHPTSLNIDENFRTVASVAKNYDWYIDGFPLKWSWKGASTFAPTGSIFLQLHFSVFSGLGHWVLSAKVWCHSFWLKQLGSISKEGTTPGFPQAGVWGQQKAVMLIPSCFSYWFKWFTVNMFEPTTRLGKNDHFTKYLSYIFAGYMYQTAVFGVQDSDASQVHRAENKSFQKHWMMTSFNHVQPIYAQLLQISWVTSPLFLAQLLTCCSKFGLRMRTVRGGSFGVSQS